MDGTYLPLLASVLDGWRELTAAYTNGESLARNAGDTLGADAGLIDIARAEAEALVADRAPDQVIERVGRPYLERWHLERSTDRAVYLHVWRGNDPDMGLHDHPAASASLCLGGVLRERWLPAGHLPDHHIRTRRLATGAVCYRSAAHAHQMYIESEATPITLFVFGARGADAARMRRGDSGSRRTMASGRCGGATRGRRDGHPLADTMPVAAGRLHRAVAPHPDPQRLAVPRSLRAVRRNMSRAPKLVEYHLIADLDPRTGRDRVRDGVVAVYIRGEYAGRLQRRSEGLSGWGCDADLTARVPWPRGARTYFASQAAALQTIRRRLRDAEHEARIERAAEMLRRDGTYGDFQRRQQEDK